MQGSPNTPVAIASKSLRRAEQLIGHKSQSVLVVI